MPTQSRVPGAASSEVDFELERFERTGADRIEIAGRWYGLRGRRFVRPVLSLHIGGGTRRRAIALLEHKPWAADDGETWVAAFAWPQGAGEVEGAELEVGPGLIVDLPALGGKPGTQGRVSALRPHAPAPMARRIAPEGEGAEAPGADGAPDAERAARPGRDGALGDPSGARSDVEARGRAGDSLPGRAGDASRGRAGDSRGRAGDASHGRAGDSSRGRAGDSLRGRAGDSSTARAGLGDPADGASRGGSAIGASDRALSAADAPEFTFRERAPAPPRDLVTAAMQERDEALTARDEAERERVQALNDRDDALSRRDAALRDVDRSAAERDEAVAERDRIAAELERVTRERDVADAERKRMMQDAEAIERERDQAAAERDAARSELSRALPERDHALREAETASARADRAESERDTAFAERKTAVAQRDRARRERDRAMRAAGIEPPADTPFVRPQASGERAAAPELVAPDEAVIPLRPEEPGIVPAAGDSGPRAATIHPAGELGADAAAAAAPPGTPLPSRPLKRIGSAPAGQAPEAKPLLTPVDSGRPRRLSRTRRPPSAPARWAVRILAILVLVAVVAVLAILLASLV